MEEFEKLLWYPIEHFPFVALTLIISFTLHEFAHAYSAYKFGDPTAKKQGRVTLNPKEHLDVLGTILIMIAGFGWARPVPVNRSNFSRPRLMGIVVSAVGPLSNLLLALLSSLAYILLFGTGALDGASRGVWEAIYYFLLYMGYLNVLLFLFNLIPLPPLDGYRIVEDLAPARLRERMDRNAHWGMIIFVLLVFIPQLRKYTLDPLFSQVVPILDSFKSMFAGLFL